ncbi:hypothetical protein KFL_004630050 [Klebsormidium nitens]|uniref:Glycosyl transferase family 1 domain-containing protein n=1 Tax=Klebsormidium nitens TaxID=105231 RepID=A0A1Y1IL58_KLENI|nr:hypothetical protein KFL_004630050 [Klebsormidium nitens]|eukprot:GAQ88838.1 hypothetical protein KFL_004630050 [Klebsormidium nitens]
MPMTSSSSGSSTESWDFSTTSSEDLEDLQLVVEPDVLDRCGKRIKCAFFSHSLQRNGANVYLLHLCSWLIDEFEVDLVSPKDGPMRADFEALGVNCSAISPSKENHRERQLLKQAQYTFVLCNTIMRAEVAVIAEEMGTPCVWVVHEAWPQDQFEYYAKEVFLMDHIDSALLHRAFSLCTRIIFPANVQKELYAGLYKDGAALCIYNGIPLDAIDEFVKSNTREEVRYAMGYEPDDFLIVQVGTVCNRKGQLYSAKAFVKLVEAGAHPNAKLLMVGARYIRDHEIKYIDEINAVVAKAGLQDRVKILDCQDDVFPFYLAADVVLQPSLNEVLPLCICEAMAFERPVIATRIDGIPEALDHHREGLLIPPADEVALKLAIKSLVDNEDERVRLGVNGRKRVQEQFSYRNMINQYKDFINNIVENDVRVQTPVRTPSTTRGFKQWEDTVTVLVDLDNTVVDWDKEFTKRWIAAGNPASDADVIKKRKRFEIEQNFNAQQTELVIKVIAQPGFYAQLEPFPKALWALQTMLQSGIDVKLVTSPHPCCRAQCTIEKYEWVAKHLGDEWFKRLIITADKTAVRGDILIDDKPAVVGSMKPQWKHVLFNASYNEKVTGKPRLTAWEDWERAVLPPSHHKIRRSFGA